MSNNQDRVWLSEGPLVLDEPGTFAWHDTADVVVVGFGCAGACAALSAREAGADVILVDRFDGGGASALSGGVYYGGGTRFQREAGFDDTAEEMFKYLALEVGGVVSERTLRRFCEESAANLEWLIQKGVKFSSSLAKESDAYMAPGNFLYYSGNERLPEYAAVARPAPRGHIAVGEGGGSMGRHLFAALRDSTVKSGARIYRHSPVVRLVTDARGRVLGVGICHLAENSVAWRRHRAYANLFHMGKGTLYGPLARILARGIANAERAGTRLWLRARRGVVLSAGGFINHREMVATYLPQHVRAIPMGSAGCTGDGINLGRAVGARADRLHAVESGRSLLLPPSFVKGILVNSNGVRFIAESAYQAKIGHEVLQHHGGKAWLLLDGKLFWDAWKTVMPWKRLILRYRVRSLMPLMFAWRRGRTLESLASKCGIALEQLKQTVSDYNIMASKRGNDPLGKPAFQQYPLERGPYYAINCSTDSRGFPPTSFTLGGLAVNEDTGQVCGTDGTPIPGLYSAGRTAIGIPSNFYVSGLSIADCVFSGRRAGREAAASSLGA